MRSLEWLCQTVSNHICCPHELYMNSPSLEQVPNKVVSNVNMLYPIISMWLFNKSEGYLVISIDLDLANR
jgi:hypothetical protein